jgi:hypothetical protein
MDLLESLFSIQMDWTSVPTEPPIHLQLQPLTRQTTKQQLELLLLKLVTNVKQL